MPPAVGGAVSGYATGNAPATVSLAAIPDGAWMLATLFQEGSYDTAAPPAGWTNLLPNASQLSGTRGQAYAAGRTEHQQGFARLQVGALFERMHRGAVGHAEGGSGVEVHARRDR